MNLDPLPTDTPEYLGTREKEKKWRPTRACRKTRNGRERDRDLRIEGTLSGDYGDIPEIAKSD